MLISTLVPGATYATSTFSIPWASLNSAVTAAGGSSTTAADSVERLLYNLLLLIQLKQVQGTITAPLLGMEVSAAGITQNSQWETTTNTFTACDIASLLASFRLTGTTTQAGGNVASV